MRDAVPVSAETCLLPAFPSSLRTEVAALVAAIPAASIDPVGHFVVQVGDEQLVVPHRIYNDDVSDLHDEWPDKQRLVADCVYTLHHDGWVRERHAVRIVEDLSVWVIPFVVNLVGEYVLEIIMAISQRLADISTPDSPQQQAYGRYFASNPDHLRITRARVISYWDCYYRRDYPVLTDYPPFRLVSAFEVAAQIEAGR